MCVRNLGKGKCPRSKRMKLKENLRHPNKVSLKSCSSKSAKRRGGASSRIMKSKEGIDLLCTEFLSHSNAHSRPWTTDLPYLELEDDHEPFISPTSSEFFFTSSPLAGVAMEPCAYDTVSESPTFYLYDHGSHLHRSRPWVDPAELDILHARSEDSPPVLCSVQESLDGHGLDDVGEHVMNGEVDMYEPCPDAQFQHFSSLPLIGDQNACQFPQLAPAHLYLGNSRQSKQLPAHSEWPGRFCPSFQVDKELRCTKNVSDFDEFLIKMISEAEPRITSDPVFASCAPGEPRLGSLRDDTLLENSRSGAQVNNIARAAVGNASNLSLRAEFREAMELLRNKESAPTYRLSNSYIERLNGTSRSERVSRMNGLRDVRKSFVEWILQMVQLLRLSTMTASRAVSIFDRNLCQRVSSCIAQEKENELEELLLTAVACIWIASKLEDCGTPQLSSIRQIAGVACDDERIRKKEVSVLKSLGWRMLGVTAGDFLGSMISHLPALGLPVNLLPVLAYRSEQILCGLLPEVKFLVYQPSVVSFSIMQYILDECMPVHTSMFMAAFHLALVVDMDAKDECYEKLMGLRLDTIANPDSPQNSLCCSLGHGKLRYGLYQLPNDSDPSGLREQNMRLPIPAF